jgi:type I restriction enzyme S subunit
MNKQKSNIPQLRFPEFEGEWKIESTGNYIDLISGYAFKGDEISEDSDGIPILRGINITEGVIRHSDDIDRYFSGDISQLKKYLLRKGDIVLGMDGSKVGKNVAIISDKDENSLLIQRVAKINNNPKSDYRFIFQRIFSPVFHQYVDVVNTSSGIPHISLQQIRDFKVGYPSLPEQQKIASFFTAIDRKISQLKRKLTLLEQYKKGVMQLIFSQQIRFKDDNGQEFPKWEKKRLVQVAEIKYGKDQKGIACENGNFPILGTGGVIGRTNEFLSDKPSVLIGRKGTIDNPIYIDVPFWTVDTLFYTNVLSIANVKWLYYKLTKINWYKYNEASGVPSLSASTINKIPINLPCLEEQSKIANFLSAIDDKINHTQNQINKAEVWKKGLMQQMFV